MSDSLYGIVEANRRARGWFPELMTIGQRAVYGILLSFCGLDGQITPTYQQLAQLADMHQSSARRIVKQLETLEAIVRIGDRPVLTSGGIAKGGRIIIWSIPPAPSEAHLANSQARSRAIPSAPKTTSKRALRGAPLKVEVEKKLQTDECPHIPIDEDGYCTACSTQVTNPIAQAVANLASAGFEFEVIEA